METFRILNCPTPPCSDKLARERIERAMGVVGAIAMRRLLCFALYLLGVNRQDIGKVLNIPTETAKSIIKALMAGGLGALEDRRRRAPTPVAQVLPQLSPITLKQEGQFIAIDLGSPGRQLKLNQDDPLQLKTVLLTMVNSGLLTNRQVAGAIGLTSPRTRALAQQLKQNGASSLVDQRSGQKQDYRVTPAIKAELIQQFAIDVITGGPISGASIADHLKERCQITISARTVRHHLSKLGLPKIKRSLPQLVATVKKTSENGV